MTEVDMRQLVRDALDGSPDALHLIRDVALDCGRTEEEADVIAYRTRTFALEIGGIWNPSNTLTLLRWSNPEWCERDLDQWRAKMAEEAAP